VTHIDTVASALSAAAARTTPAPCVPEGSVPGKPALAATTWQPGWTVRPAPLHAEMGGEGRELVVQPFTTDAHVFTTRVRHLLPQRLAGHPPSHRGGREHHVQNFVQRRGGWLIWGQQVGGAQPEAPRRRSCSLVAEGTAGHRHRRASRSTTVPVAGRRDRPPPRRILRLQRQFRELKGTAIIYDQTRATESARRRKRGTMVDPGAWSSTSWCARVVGPLGRIACRSSR
jgi:hypothetical protein